MPISSRRDFLPPASRFPEEPHRVDDQGDWGPRSVAHALAAYAGTLQRLFISGKALIMHPFSPDWYVGWQCGRAGTARLYRRGDALRAAVTHGELARARGVVRAGAC